MPFQFVNLDVTMIVLNTTSFGILALNWFSEHMTGIGGFIVMVSVAVLNIAKAYREIKKNE